MIYLVLWLEILKAKSDVGALDNICVAARQLAVYGVRVVRTPQEYMTHQKLFSYIQKLIFNWLDVITKKKTTERKATECIDNM